MLSADDYIEIRKNASRKMADICDLSYRSGRRFLCPCARLARLWLSVDTDERCLCYFGLSVRVDYQILRESL